MGSTPQQPKPPDPTQTANAQWDFTKNALNYSANANTPNLYTPFGSVTYQKDANGMPISQNVSLDPTQQRTLDTQRQASLGLTQSAVDQLKNLPNSPFTLESLGIDMPGSTNYQDWGNKVAQTYYDQAAGLIRPDIQQGQQRLDQTLSDRGLPISGEAYQTAQGNYQRGTNNQLNSIANNAILASGNEMSRLQGLQSDAFNTRLNASLTERSLPFNELAAYLGGAPQQPYQNAQPTAPLNAQAPDYAGLQGQNYNAQMQQYQQKLQQQQALWGSIGDLAGSAFKYAPYAL